MALRRVAAAQRDQVRLELAVGLADIGGAPTLSTAQSCLHALLDEALLYPVHLARTDTKDLGDRFPPRRMLVEFALVTIEQDQRIDHLLRPMQAFTGDARQFVPLLFLQGHRVALHPCLLVLDRRPEGYHDLYDISRMT